MSKQLDRHFETLFLLLYPEWDEEQKQETLAAIDSVGIDGASFYTTNFPPIERYYAAFRKHRVDSAATKGFETLSAEAFFVYVMVFRSHPTWFESFNEVSDETAREAVVAAVVDLLEGEEDIMTALESGEFTDQARWQILALLQQPKQRLASVVKAVQDNIPAFEFAALEVKTELDILLSKFESYVDERDLSSFMRIPRTFDPHAEIIPTLAIPIGVMVMEGICFYGLLIDQLLVDKEVGYSKGEIVLGAKALSDTSKVEILHALKDGSLYSLEIANKVGLTPATVSHHMKTLITAGFVDIQKREAKVYYSLSEKGLEKFLNGVHTYLFE